MCVSVQCTHVEYLLLFHWVSNFSCSFFFSPNRFENAIESAFFTVLIRFFSFHCRFFSLLFPFCSALFLAPTIGYYKCSMHSSNIYRRLAASLFVFHIGKNLLFIRAAINIQTETITHWRAHIASPLNRQKPTHTHTLFVKLMEKNTHRINNNVRIQQIKWKWN